GEGDGEDLRGAGATEAEDVGDTRCQHTRFARSGAGEHQHRPVQRLDRLALLRIETRQIRRRHLRARTRCDPAGGGRRRWNVLTRWLGHGLSTNLTPSKWHRTPALARG